MIEEQKPLKNNYSLKIAKPNLGQPFFLKIDDPLKESSFATHLLIATSITKAEICETLLKDNIELIPLLDYKLELQFLLEKKRQEQQEQQQKIKKASKRKRSLWSRLFRKKRKPILNQETLSRLTLEGEQIAFEIKGMEEKLKSLKPRIYRGDPIKANIIEIVPVTPLEIHNSNYLDEHDRPQGYLIKYKAFEMSYFFFRVSIRFQITEEIIAFLQKRNFVMFDILIPSEDIVNYHSFVLSKQDWSNMTFIHATDLHLADRNDKIYAIVKSFTQNKFIQQGRQFFNTLKKNLQKSISFSTREKLLQKPLRKRLINPNNQFRKFIKIVNRMVLSNEVSFVAITGDLIDFTLLSKFGTYENITILKKLFKFDYEESNWQIFKNILLNKQPSEKLKGVIKSQEALFPIFTIPGNHDYRPYAYDLTWGGMYKKIGLNATEAAALNDRFPVTKTLAIIKTPLALKGYFSEINASLDYFFRLGNNIFLFLDTGSDSFQNVRDLITGHPSLTGLSQRQIKFMENVINYKYKKGDNIFLFLHGPPINTGKKRSIIKRVQKKFGMDLKTNIEEFKESLHKRGKISSKSRIDGKFNVKYGTVSKNWEKLIKFCKDFCVLTLSGHTHLLREYRLKDPEIKTKVFDAPPFSLKKIENPAAVFYDIYSERYKNVEEIEKNGPFIVQTPALGLRGYKKPSLEGAYRIIEIKNGKLASFKVDYINQ